MQLLTNTQKKNVNAVVQATHPDDTWHMRSAKCNKMNHFREVCWSIRGSVVHNIEQEADQEQKNHMGIVNINSVNFNANPYIITANLKHHQTKS